MKIALTADHAGYEQAAQLRVFLESINHACVYFGPTKLDPNDDYPDFVFPAANAVASGECEMAIVIGGSGQGEAMAANRIKGVRCSVFYGSVIPRGIIDAEGRVSHDPYEILRLSRLHNDANMLSLAGRFLGIDEVKNAAKLWLETDFSGNERHQRRNMKLDGGY